MAYCLSFKAQKASSRIGLSENLYVFDYNDPIKDHDLNPCFEILPIDDI